MLEGYGAITGPTKKKETLKYLYWKSCIDTEEQYTDNTINTYKKYQITFNVCFIF